MCLKDADSYILLVDFPIIIQHMHASKHNVLVLLQVLCTAPSH